MTNGNDPITPHLTYNKTSGHADGFVEGLTKREHIAIAAMQGILSSIGQHDVTDFKEMASDAVMATDALINALNQTK